MVPATALFERVEIRCEVGRKRRVDLEPLAGERMREAEVGGVQELPRKPGLGHAVDGVADDRQVDRRQVDADLVHPPGFERDPKQRLPSGSAPPPRSA